MRTRAVAVASERSNAIGAVELECTPLGLSIVHHGVGAFQEGYAPGALTMGTRVLVPWEGVREASFEGDRLFLHLDEALTPHNRLVLAGFSIGDPPDPAEQQRQRLILRIGTGVAMVVAALLVALTMARVSADGGAGAAVLLGIFGAGVVFFIGMVAEHRLGLAGGAARDGVRLAFATELSVYLPALALSMQPADGPRKPPAPPLELPSFQSLLPRSTTAVVITMSAALLGAVLTASWVARTPAREAADEPARRERARPEEMPQPAALPEPIAQGPAAPSPAAPPAAVAPPAPPPAAAANATEVPLTGSCTCRRADSLLWRDGIPRMSTVLIERRAKSHNNHPHLELELGVVNNWDQPLSEVRLLVQFYDKDPPPSTKRTPTFDRPLYFEGPLDPGQAIKWHVEARGNDFEVIGPPDTMLDDGASDAAPTNLIAELLRANHRPIRLHGAMMLAFLGDPRAKEGTLGLREALREDEAPYIDRLTWTLSDVKTCSVAVPGGGSPRPLRACVFNGSKGPLEHLAMRVRALDRPFRHDTPVEAPPLVVAEHVWKLGGKLEPGQGALASVALDTENPDGVAPAAFEAYADREEIVF